MMSVDRRQRVEELFQEAADLPRAERSAFLGGRCADSSVRAEVGRLLAHLDEAEGKFLATPLLEGIAAAEPVQMPARIGRYRVLRKIGEGGMGAVFEAEQDHPRRRVALKVIRMAMGSASVLRRFEREVEILGQLQHPGIAQIYEAGTYDDGAGCTPYFAMEYIQGQPLTEYAKDRRLSSRDRLNLMAAICDAVQHAHQKGVIHRDLKPANILVEEVEGSPRPRILDFGVARALHVDLHLITMQTEAGQLLGTLSYMSPEQIAGAPAEIDARSDVYTLGVILYEMLAERFPYDLRNRSLAAASTLIREQEPSRLSSISTAFRGDVETIVAKALAKEKERRYESAADFALDIRRFLRDEPIVARPMSRAYRFRKFTKRNKAVVGGVAATFAVLILGIVGTGIALVRARNAESLALARSAESQRSAAKTAAVKDFLQEMLSSVDPARALGREVTIRQALDEAAAKILAGALKNEPEVEAELRMVIGATYQSLGHYPEAESHLKSAVEIHKALYGAGSIETAQSLQALALLFSSLGRHGEAASLLRETLKIQTHVHGERNADAASAMQSLGAALRAQSKFAEAEPYYRKSLAIRRELFGEEHVDVAQSLNSLALLQQNKGNLKEAESLFRQSLVMRRKVLGEPHPVVADSLNNLANLLVQEREFDSAEPLLREALAMRRQLLPPEHPGIAQSQSNLAYLLHEKGAYAEAEPLLREALTIWRKTLPEGHADIGTATAMLGMVLAYRKEFAEAEPLLREAYRIRQRTMPPDHWLQFDLMSVLGYTLAVLGHFEEAEPLLLKSHAGMKDAPAFSAGQKANALNRVIYLYESWGRPQEAARWRSGASPSDDRS